jgi:hypothetical protein
VASSDEGRLTLLDEWGLFEAELSATAETPAAGSLVLVEGVAAIDHGAAALHASNATPALARHGLRLVA